MSPDLRAADRVNDYLDAVGTGDATRSPTPDPAITATIERFFAADDAPGPPAGLANQIWAGLMDQAATVELIPSLPAAAPNRNGGAPRPFRPTNPATRGPSALAFLATAALIALAAIGSFAALRGSPPGSEQQAIVIDAIDETPEGGLPAGVDGDGVLAPQVATPAASPEPAAPLAEFVAEIQLGTSLSSTPAGVAVGADGVLYVIEAAEDRIRLFDPDGQPIGAWGETGEGPGQFRFHANAASWGDLDFGPDGNLYVLDPFNSRVQVLGSDGDFVREWGEAGGGEGQFAEPSGLAVDRSGRVYVADTLNGRVQVFDRDGRFLAAWAPSSSDGGPLRSPFDVAVDPADVVSVTDWMTKRVVRFDADGTVIGRFGGSETEPDHLSDPAGVTSDAQGNLFVSDSVGNQIQVFAPDGTLLGAIGGVGVEPGQFISPGYLALGPDGLLYVSDEGNRRIQIFRLAVPEDAVSATRVPGSSAAASQDAASPAPVSDGWGTGDLAH